MLFQSISSGSERLLNKKRQLFVIKKTEIVCDSVEWHSIISTKLYIPDISGAIESRLWVGNFLFPIPSGKFLISKCTFSITISISPNCMIEFVCLKNEVIFRTFPVNGFDWSATSDAMICDFIVAFWSTGFKCFYLFWCSITAVKNVLNWICKINPCVVRDLYINCQ